MVTQVILEAATNTRYYVPGPIFSFFIVRWVYRTAKENHRRKVAHKAWLAQRRAYDAWYAQEYAARYHGSQVSDGR